MSSPFSAPAETSAPQADGSAVSWGAIMAGAAAAAALSLILLLLGSGLGLSAASPWARSGTGTTAFGVSTILWVTLTQLLASGMGGYLAGRLRTRWLLVHGDEVYFRDTAHGFLAWAVASLATAALLTSAIGSIVGNGMQAGSEIARFESDGAPTDYFIESLFRREINASATRASREPAANAVLAEVARIFMNTARNGPLLADDQRYIGQVVAQHTGLTLQAAEKRVGDTYERVQAKLRDLESTAQATAERARKASAYAALWLFISLLIGAFVASLAATYGGQRRDL